MKLLRIRTRNLNSLYGEQVVDLEGTMGDAPIFLILGPTGAGKSTLMDAISLALFGETPRLNLPRSDTDLENDCRNVMSRGTGEALAEVTVAKHEQGRTVRYRATWSCRRAHGRADGALQDPVRTLERADGGGSFVTLVENRQKKVYREHFDGFLEGMSVEDFKRSMLLAQGEFSRFLKASEAEKSSILERLTDSSIYKDLGQRAAAKRKDAQKRLEVALAALDGVHLLGEEEEAALKAQLAALKPVMNALRSDRVELHQFVSWLAQRSALNQELAGAEAKLQEAVDERKARCPELTQLAEHERCAPLSPLLREVERLRAECLRLQVALPPLRASAAELTARLAPSERKEADATEAVAVHSKRAAQLAPKLAWARKLLTELQLARMERTKATEAWSTAVKDAGQHAQLAAALQAIAEQTGKALGSAQAAVAALAAAEPLVEAVAGLRARFEGLASSRSAITDRAASLVRATKELKQARAGLGALMERQVQASAGLTEREQMAKAAHSALGALMEGAADVASRRRALRSGGERIHANAARLKALSLEEEAVGALSAALQSEAEAAEVSLSAANDAQARIAAGAAEVEAAEASLDKRRAELEENRLVRDLARHRLGLKEGADCPLCGSAEHPYLADGRVAELDARVQARCAALEVELSQMERALASLRAELQRLEKLELTGRARADAAGLRVAQLQRELAAKRVALEEGAKGLGLAASDPAALAAAQEALDAQARSVNGLLEALEQAEASDRAAKEGLEKASAELTRLGDQVGAAEAAIADKAARAEADGAKLEQDRAGAAVDETTLGAQLRAFGVPIDGGLSRAMELAEATVAQVKAAQAQLERATAASQRVSADAQAAAIRADAAKVAVGEAQARLAERRQAVEALEPDAEAALGGQHPDVVEKQLEQDRVTLSAALQGAQKAFEQLRVDVSKAQQALELSEKQSAERAAELKDAAARLDAALLSRSLSEADLRSRLLSEPEHEALRALRTRLERAETGCRQLSDDRRAALLKHEAARPAIRDAWGARALPVLMAECARVEDEIKAQDVREGSLVEKLSAQDAARAAWSAKQKAAQALQTELDTWERLHGLIGVNDGQAFQRYAQTLNLAELMMRANHHLERLAPRYSLVGARDVEGHARLAFAIKDAFQADEVRPINTLSGGETFLVSLALALGLAGYRTVKMPIETLLLDEGFGTLDPETLQVAMSALEALHATGTQVGIISHVEALKERIPARVLVERDGAGRSSVRVEAN